MFDSFQAWATTHALLGIPAWRWLVAATITTTAFVLFYAFIKLLARGLPRRASGTVAAAVVAAARHTRWLLVLIAFLVLGSQALGLSPRASKWLAVLGTVVVALQIGLWVNSMVRTWTTHTLESGDTGSHNPVVVAMLSWIMRIMVWATLLLLALSIAGVNITAFVASLGVGGVAVALALQNVLGDLFASMSIGLDKPFEIGQLVRFGDVSGTISHVGVKTTRIRSLSGEEIIIGNAKLLGNTLQNFGRMTERRIVFGFGVTYDAPLDKLREIPAIVKKIVEDTPDTRFDRAHFKALGESSLDFEVVFYITRPEFLRYRDAQQAINFALMETFAQMGLEFAFPSRTLYMGNALALKREPEDDQTRRDDRGQSNDSDPQPSNTSPTPAR